MGNFRIATTYRFKHFQAETIYISLGRYKSVCLVIMKKLNFSFTVRDLRSKDEFKYINE